MINALLFNSYDSLLTADEHSLPVPLLYELVGIDGNNITHLKRALKSLTTTGITWDVLDDNGDSSWSFAALLSGGTIKNGICTYRYSIACIKAIDAAFASYSEQEQKDLRDAFLQGEDFGSFQITDFRQNGWGSRMILPQAIRFWMGRTKLPLISDISSKSPIGSKRI